MNYANYLLMREFVNDQKEFPNESFQTHLGPDMENMTLTPQETKKLIETYKDMLGSTYFQSLQAIWHFNGQALNDRAIVSCHTLITDYLISRNKGELSSFIDTHDWFKILGILRDLASHGWKIKAKEGLRFTDKDRSAVNGIKLYPDVLTFHTITLTRGQKTVPEINEVQVSKLVQHSIAVFLKDPNFNPHTEHAQSRDEPK
jgi:hypothetical protein